MDVYRILFTLASIKSTNSQTMNALSKYVQHFAEYTIYNLQSF